MDASEGITPADELILQELRVLNKPTRLVANKMDGVKQAQLLALEELSGLGLATCCSFRLRMATVSVHFVKCLNFFES